MDPFSLTAATALGASAGTSGAIGAAGAGLSILGGLTSALGLSNKGDADASMYSYKAGIAKMNASIERQNSDYSLTAGDANAQRSGLTTGFTIAKEKTSQAANGFDVNTGSAVEVRDSTRSAGLIDQDTIRTEAGRQALGHRNAAANYDAEATGDIMAGDNARRAGKIAALGTLIGTAGSVASKWTQASQVWGGGTKNPYFGPLDYNGIG